MTKVDILKAKTYAIELLENQANNLQEENKRNKEYYRQNDEGEIPEWTAREIAENNKKITYINTVIDEIAK